MKRTRRLGPSPRRLAQGDPTRFETRLVREAQLESPPAGASSRALMALGLATTAGAATVAGTAQAAANVAANVAASKVASSHVAASAIAVGQVGATQVAAAVGHVVTVQVATAVGGAMAPITTVAGKGLLGGGLLAWLAGGVVAVAATVGVVQVLSPPESQPTPNGASDAPPAIEAPTPSVGSSTKSSADITPPARQEPAREAPVTPRVPMPPASTVRSGPSAPSPTAPTAPTAPSEVEPQPSGAPPASASPQPAASTLGREVTLVDGARAALQSGDPARALSMLDRYDHEFPAGTLAPESARLRARASAMLRGPQ